MPSSVIQTFVYDKEERRLTVRFVSDRVYSYANVPAAIVAGFATASSKGHYFNEYVRDRFLATRSRCARAG